MSMRTSEDRSGPLVTCIDNTGRSPVLTGELVPVDWHGLPVQVTNGPDRSSEVLILRVLCIPFSQQSAGTEPLALPDLTRLKPLPCLLALPALACGPPSTALSSGLTSPPMSGPVLRPYHPLQVRHPSFTQSLGPTTPHRLGLHLPCPPPLPLPYQPSQVPLHCLMIYAITLVFSFPGPFSYFPLSPSPPKARLATPKIIAPLKNNIILYSISVRESLIFSYK